MKTNKDTAEEIIRKILFTPETGNQLKDGKQLEFPVGDDFPQEVFDLVVEGLKQQCIQTTFSEGKLLLKTVPKEGINENQQKTPEQTTAQPVHSHDAKSKLYAKLYQEIPSKLTSDIYDAQKEGRKTIRIREGHKGIATKDYLSVISQYLKTIGHDVALVKQEAGSNMPPGIQITFSPSGAKLEKIIEEAQSSQQPAPAEMPQAAKQPEAVPEAKPEPKKARPHRTTKKPEEPKQKEKRFKEGTRDYKTLEKYITSQGVIFYSAAEERAWAEARKKYGTPHSEQIYSEMMPDTTPVFLDKKLIPEAETEKDIEELIEAIGEIASKKILYPHKYLDMEVVKGGKFYTIKIINKSKVPQKKPEVQQPQAEKEQPTPASEKKNNVITQAPAGTELFLSDETPVQEPQAPAQQAEKKQEAAAATQVQPAESKPQSAEPARPSIIDHKSTMADTMLKEQEKKDAEKANQNEATINTLVGRYYDKLLKGFPEAVALSDDEAALLCKTEGIDILAKKLDAINAPKEYRNIIFNISKDKKEIKFYDEKPKEPATATITETADNTAEISGSAHRVYNQAEKETSAEKAETAEANLQGGTIDELFSEGSQEQPKAEESESILDLIGKAKTETEESKKDAKLPGSVNVRDEETSVEGRKIPAFAPEIKPIEPKQEYKAPAKIDYSRETLVELAKKAGFSKKTNKMIKNIANSNNYEAIRDAIDDIIESGVTGLKGLVSYRIEQEEIFKPRSRKYNSWLYTKLHTRR